MCRLSNADNDVAGITVTPTSGLTTTEASGTATFTVVLNYSAYRECNHRIEQLGYHRRDGLAGQPDLHHCQLGHYSDCHRDRRR